MDKYILAIDQGTTSTRAIVFSKEGKIINQASEEITQYYPKNGYVEHNATEIFSKTLAVMLQAVVSSNLNFSQIEAIGITNQRETIVVWDKKTQLPVYNAIVWQSNQSKDVCEEYREYEDLIKEKTGLLLNPYFSATKLRWLFNNYPDIERRAFNGELLCGTIDSWLIYKLTGGNVHKTDYSNASRTLLFNINKGTWDDDLLKLFKIPKCILPVISNSNSFFGYLDKSVIPFNIPITGVLGDQQAALFGQCCFEKGELKNTYGTGCFTLLNTGDNIVKSKHGLLTTVAWSIDNEISYALEGSVFIGGAAVQWLRDGLRMIKKSSDSEKYATAVDSSDGVYIVPSFTGLGTPYWDADVKGAIFGLTRATNKEIFIRATLEAIAYQCKDVIKTMVEESNIELKSLCVDGGATDNSFLMQFQSDILDCKIILQKVKESTALGAALIAGLGVGIYNNLDEIKEIKAIKKTFVPKMDREEAKRLYDGWLKAIKSTISYK